MFHVVKPVKEQALAQACCPAAEVRLVQCVPAFQVHCLVCCTIDRRPTFPLGNSNYPSEETPDNLPRKDKSGRIAGDGAVNTPTFNPWMVQVNKADRTSVLIRQAFYVHLVVNNIRSCALVMWGCGRRNYPAEKACLKETSRSCSTTAPSSSSSAASRIRQGETKILWWCRW